MENLGKYKIKKGDTFWGLEQKNGFEVGILSEINPDLDPRRLQIGQEINFPLEENKYTIKSGDTFWGLEQKNGFENGILTELNPDVDPRRLQIGQEINFPKHTNVIKPPKDKQTPKKDFDVNDIINAAKLVIETYIKNGVKYSQRKREIGLDAKYSDCSATVNTIMIESGQLSKLKSVYTGGMRREIEAKGGSFRKDNPLEGDIMMWGGHVTVVTEIKGGSLYFAHMGNSGPRIGRVTLTNNRLDTENVWGSGGFIGFWTIK